MSPVDRFQPWLLRLAWCCAGVAVVLAVLLWRAYAALPGLPAAAGGGAGAAEPLQPAAWPAAGEALPETAWTVFEAGGAPPAVDEGSLAARFRLAGTFVAYGSNLDDERRAVLDDLEVGTQRIVSEQQLVGAVRVVRILSDRVILRRADGREESLWLSFSDRGGAAAGAADSTAAAAGGGAASGATGRYGSRRVGENRWVFERGALLDYYAELMDDPDRLIDLFDSMSTLRAPSGDITGYRLKIVGERDFFSAVGLREGDVVRGVNSMAMTSRRRAEYFIKEFVANRANAFVLDIERAGRREKLIYQVR